MGYLSELPKFSKKEKLTAATIIAAAAVVSTAFLIFFSIKINRVPLSSLSPTPPFADWKTTTSPKHNFSFSYPNYLNLPIQNRAENSWSFEINGKSALDITAANVSLEDAKAKYPSVNFKKANEKTSYADFIHDDKTPQRRLYIIELEKGKYIWILAYISAFDTPLQEIEQMLNTVAASITRL